MADQTNRAYELWTVEFNAAQNAPHVTPLQTTVRRNTVRLLSEGNPSSWGHWMLIGLVEGHEAAHRISKRFTEAWRERWGETWEKEGWGECREAKRPDGEAYLVGRVEGRGEWKEMMLPDMAIVHADSPQDAVREYIRQVQIHEDEWLDYVRDRSTNAGFAESFWLRTEDDEARFMQDPGELVSKEDFNARVRKFFGPHDEWAEQYLDFYWDDDDEAEPDFSLEMMAYMYRNSTWAKIDTIPLSQMPQVQQ